MKNKTITLTEEERGWLYATLKKTRDKFQINYQPCRNDEWYKRKDDLLKGLLKKLEPSRRNNE